MANITQGIFPNSGPSILDGKDRGNQKVKRDYIKDFYNNQKKSSYFHADYDEPTYLTFRIAFTFADPSNISGYNEIPMPFLNLDSGAIKNTTESVNNEIQTAINGMFNGDTTLIANAQQNKDSAEYAEIQTLTDNLKSKIGTTVPGTRKGYSTQEYLINIKESKRALLLTKFVNMLNSLQTDYPYYFKSIEGLSNLLKVDPKRGMRMNPEESTITIKCYEGLDMRITELLNTYKKIVWDDVYQRWMVPDMMRYFQMKIYISEIRNFHISTITDLNTNVTTLSNQKNGGFKVLNTIANVINSVTSWLPSFSATDAWGLLNNELNNYMPTLCITCNQCEFLIDDTMSHLGTLSSFNNKTVADDLQIKIKVGNISEAHAYPLSGDHAFLYTTYKDLQNAAGENTAAFDKYSRLNDEELYRVNEYSSAKQTTKDIIDVKYGRGGYTKFSDESDHGSYEKDRGSGQYQAGLIGGVVKSAINWGIAWADNWANDQLNKLINTPIDGTISVQEALNALNSKDAVNMYNTVRDAMKKSAELKEQDKKKKSIDLADEAFKSYIREFANLPLTTAASDDRSIDDSYTQNMMIEVAKKINDADLNTEELDQFFKIMNSMYVEESTATSKKGIKNTYWITEALGERLSELEKLIENPEINYDKKIEDLIIEEPEEKNKSIYVPSIEENAEIVKNIDKINSYSEEPLSKAIKNAETYSTEVNEDLKDVILNAAADKNHQSTPYNLSSYQNIPKSEATENFEYLRSKNLKNYSEIGENDTFDYQKETKEHILSTNKQEIKNNNILNNKSISKILPNEIEDNTVNTAITKVKAETYDKLPLSEAVENINTLHSQNLSMNSLKNVINNEAVNKKSTIDNPYKDETGLNHNSMFDIENPYNNLALSEAVENKEVIESSLLDMSKSPELADNKILRAVAMPTIDIDLPLSEAVENKKYVKSEDLLDYYEIKNAIDKPLAIHNVIDVKPDIEIEDKKEHIEKLVSDDNLTLSSATNNFILNDYNNFLSEIRKIAFSAATENKEIAQVAAIIYTKLKSSTIKKIVGDGTESVMKTIKDIYKESSELSNEDRKFIKTLYDEVEINKKNNITVPEFVNDIAEHISIIKPYEIDDPGLSKATSVNKIEKIDIE